MDSERRVLRWEIPIDDKDHPTTAVGPILKAAGCRWGAVEFWSMEGDPRFRVPVPQRMLRIFGTGQPIPAGYEWLATAERTAEGYVWHLLERVPGGVLTVDTPVTRQQAEEIRRELVARGLG